MAVDFSTLVYLPNYDMFARPIIITPRASQPGAPAYSARGIYDTRPIDVQAQDGSIVSDQQTIIDILEVEFAVLPEQLDQISVPADINAGRALGDFEVTNTETNGGGETTLTVRKLRLAQPQ